jgi:hypothetical protein
MVQEAVIDAAPAFSVGRVISVSFAVLGRNLIPFLVISLTISIPYIVFQTWIDIRDLQRVAQGGVSGFGGAVSYVQAVTFSLVQAALTYGTLQDLRGRPAGLDECFRHGLQASGRIIGAALLYSFVQLLALIAFVVPAIIVAVIWWVYVPAIVVENLRIGASFKRSQVLTFGRRWQIFALIALTTVVGIGIVVGVGLTVPGIVGAIAATLLAVLFSSYFSVMTAVGYYYLRSEKEGIVIDDIASVFD